MEFMERSINRGSEFQIVIVVDGEDGRMFPLTDNYPRCLLPVGNRKLLSYQLDMLIMSGVTEVILVALREFETQFVQFLATYTRNGLKVDLVLVDEMEGSADGIRAASDRIHSDFIYMSSDAISQFSLGELANLHRLRSSDVTLMLIANHNADVKRDEIDEEFIGLGKDGRIVIKARKVNLDSEDEPALHVSKPLLQYCPEMQLRADLVDAGICILSRWVLQLIVSNKKMTSIRTDVVPFLLKRQFQTPEYLFDNVPALWNRNRPLEALESWLTSPALAANSAGAGLFMHQNYLVLDSFKNQNRGKAITSNDSAGTLATNQGGKDSYPGVSEGPYGKDILRCFALVYDHDMAEASTRSAGSANQSPSPNTILTRVVDIPSYLALNKDVLLHRHGPRTPWEKFSNFLKKEMSIVGEGCDVSGKNVTIKQCCIGNNCTIGQMAKLNNCIIMDGVKIGDNCTIQNSIICEHVVIDNMCKLNDCLIGSDYHVPAGSKMKNDTLTSA